MITGDDLRKVLHDWSLDQRANANERHRLGHVSYYLTSNTADLIAAQLNDLARARAASPPDPDRKPTWGERATGTWHPGDET